MRILAFADYLFAGPWRPEAWIARICSALVDRGHEVRLACDGGRDPAAFVPCPTLVRRPLRTWRAGSPLAFSRWAARLTRSIPHDASLSFSALAIADAVLPIGGAAATLRMMAGVMNPLAVGLELLHQPWLPAAAAIEASLARSGPGVRLRIGLARDADEAAALGFASALPWSGAAARAQRVARARVRNLIGINPRRPVILLSSVHPKRPGLDPMLHALAQARGEARPALAPLVLAVGRNGYSIHAAAARAGCPNGVRILGGTGRIADLLDACDLLIAPGAARGEGTGRLIADALRRGRAVLADRDAPGAGLLHPSAENAYSAPGLVVERRTAAAWREALAAGLNDDWIEATSSAACSAGKLLSIDSLAARLEGVLERAATRRSAPPILSRP